jgi:hypothetical protein
VLFESGGPWSVLRDPSRKPAPLTTDNCGFWSNRSDLNSPAQTGRCRLLAKKRESRKIVNSGMRAIFAGESQQWLFSLSSHVVCRFLLLAVVLAACAGCRGRSDKSAVNGTVKFKKGELIDQGMIEFSPLDTKSGNQSGARISEGTYEIPQDKGLRPGKYIVRISAPSGLLSGQGAPGSGKMELPKERVSQKYNVKSKLEVEVKPEPLQTFDFEVD